MGAPRLKEEDLTPEALEERGQRLIAEGQRLVIRAQVRRELSAQEWIDQDQVPEKFRARYIKLCRRQALPAVKEGRRWLVLRSDFNAYLQKHRPAVFREDDEGIDDIIDRVMNDDGEKTRR